MSKLPLCSSDEVIRALERAGFRPVRRSRGAHLAMSKRVGDRVVTTVVVLGKREVPRGTLRNILRLAELSNEQFVALLRS